MYCSPDILHTGIYKQYFVKTWNNWHSFVAKYLANEGEDKNYWIVKNMLIVEIKVVVVNFERHILEH